MFFTVFWIFATAPSSNQISSICLFASRLTLTIFFQDTVVVVLMVLRRFFCSARVMLSILSGMPLLSTSVRDWAIFEEIVESEKERVHRIYDLGPSDLQSIISAPQVVSVWKAISPYAS
jgi:hypothetical protein